MKDNIHECIVWMMNRASRAILLLVFLSGSAGAAGPVDRSQWFEPGTPTTDDPRRVPVPADPAASATKIVLTGGRVFDGTGAPARTADVFIEGKSIVAVVAPGTREVPADARVIDASGKTVMPGLIDMHVHMSYPDPRSDNDQSEADATLRSIERLRYYIESGITTVRDTGGRSMIPFRLKRWVRENRLPLPRIYAAGDIITGKGGHGAEGLVDRIGSREASGPDDWRQAVREQFEKGADFIKLASHYSRAEVAAAIDEAHALGLRVTADAETQYIQWAVEAGIDMIEHPLPRTDETIRLMVAGKVASIPTLVPYIYIVDQSGGYYNSTSRRFSLTKESTFDMLVKLKQAGVKLGVGTDLVDVWYRYLPAPYITELQQFVAAGFTTAQALSIATRTNAELLGMDDRLGTLEAGKLADVIIVDGRPDERLDDLRAIDVVVRNGNVVVEKGQVSIPRHVPEAPPAPRMNVEKGQIRVPENRARSTGRTVSIPYYRLRSTSAKPAAPIFMIAGGPGTSFLARFDAGEMYEEVQHLRRVADVVLYDQRGAGRSQPLLSCPQRLHLALDRAITADEYSAAMRDAAVECRTYWQEQGVDLSGYTSLESADDLVALKDALGYGKISLLAGSYGSHLSLTTIRRHPQMIERAVLYGIEGPDHTYDLPSGTLEDLRRLAAAAEQSAQIKPRVPPGGLIAAFQTVLDRVEKAPQSITVDVGGKPVTVMIGTTDVQRVAKDGAHNRGALSWASNVIAMYEGNLTAVARSAIEDRTAVLPSAMFFIMDCASGISPARRKRLQEDPAELAARDILGDVNFEYATCDSWNAPDLGASFRADIVSDTPVMFLQGTWDISTPYKNANDVAPHFRNGRLVTVEGGTHSTTRDLYQSWEPWKALLADFLAGRKVQVPARIELPAPRFQ